MKKEKRQSSFWVNLFKWPFKIIFSYFTLALLALIIQFGIISYGAIFFSKYLLWLFGGAAVCGFILVIYIINRPDNPSFQLLWIILILLFPAFGICVYLFVKFQVGVHTIAKKYENIKKQMAEYKKQDDDVFENLKNQDDLVANYVTYMNRMSGYPIYQNTKTKYYTLGDDVFPDLIEDLKNATEYIFLEFFIVSKGYMWDTILEILKEKAQRGVRVCFMYDGTCSFLLLPRDYPKYLSSLGIECKVFHPVVPIVSTHYNNRDHRKIVVVDGKVAYTGGFNLADEYINKEVRFGHWKDTGIRVTGDAVKSFVLMFLETWQDSPRKKVAYTSYIKSQNDIKSSSYVLPFGDNPFDEYQVGQVTYLHMLNTAKRYVHIMTPYLILDHEMLMSLINSARSGVDIKIIMPHIPDKKVIYYVGRSYYKTLLKAGVEIYEYTPGFVHAKMFVSDDEKGVVGTINLDYRSLYLHFEDGVFLYKDSSIFSMEKDFQETLKQCEKITFQNIRKFSVLKTLVGKVLRVIAPLL